MFDPGYAYTTKEQDKDVDIGHLCIVLSRPFKDANGAPSVLVVKTSSWTAAKDQSCVVEIGEHAYFTKKSCIFYRDSYACPVAVLELGRKAAKIDQWNAISAAQMKRIHEGAIISEFMKPDFKRILEAQGLVDAAFIAAHPIED